MRAATYTADARELERTRAHCRRRGWHISAEYVDRGHASVALFRLLQNAERYDVIVVPALDHLIGTTTSDPFCHLHRLLQLDVAFESVAERTFRSMGPNGLQLATIAAWIAAHQPPGQWPAQT